MYNVPLEKICATFHLSLHFDNTETKNLVYLCCIERELSNEIEK